MTQRNEIDAIKAAFVQATPEGASVPALIQAMLELIDAWQAISPVAVERGEAAELARLRAEVKRLRAELEKKG